MGKSDNDNNWLLRLSKRDRFWRMDAEGYSRFMKHVCNYFRECNNPSEQTFAKVLYAEIEEEDLVIVCPLFGALIPDENTLMLTEILPHIINMPWGSSFTLRLYVDTGEGQMCLVRSRMKARSDLLTQNKVMQ